MKVVVQNVCKRVSTTRMCNSSINCYDEALSPSRQLSFSRVNVLFADAAVALMGLLFVLAKSFTAESNGI